MTSVTKTRTPTGNQDPDFEVSIYSWDPQCSGSGRSFESAIRTLALPAASQRGTAQSLPHCEAHQGSLSPAAGLIGLSQPIYLLQQRLQKVRKAKPKHLTVSHIKSLLRKLMRQDQSIPSLQPAQKGPAGLRGERQVPVQNHQVPSR